MEHLKNENIWLKKSAYEEAETQYYEKLAKANSCPVKYGEKEKQSGCNKKRKSQQKSPTSPSVDVDAIKFYEKKVVEFEKTINALLDRMQLLELRVSHVEKRDNLVTGQQVHQIEVNSNTKQVDDDDEDVDLFGSGSEDENETVSKIREERLAAYNAKKSKKPVLIAKSNVILDVKPWDDETDMQKLEQLVRKISCDGLLWGAAKLVPLAYGIRKLQISCVVEDEKVSIDWLQDEIISNEEYVQSVDIAAFNKI